MTVGPQLVVLSSRHGLRSLSPRVGRGSHEHTSTNNPEAGLDERVVVELTQAEDAQTVTLTPIGSLRAPQARDAPYVGHPIDGLVVQAAEEPNIDDKPQLTLADQSYMPDLYSALRFAVGSRNPDPP